MALVEQLKVNVWKKKCSSTRCIGTLVLLQSSLCKCASYFAAGGPITLNVYTCINDYAVTQMAS